MIVSFHARTVQPVYRLAWGMQLSAWPKPYYAWLSWVSLPFLFSDPPPPPPPLPSSELFWYAVSRLDPGRKDDAAVNLQYGASDYEKFKLNNVEPGVYTIESGAFSGVFLCMETNGVDKSSAFGVGTVNGLWERSSEYPLKRVAMP